MRTNPWHGPSLFGLALAFLAAVAVLAAMPHAAATQNIVTAGPLTDIEMTDDTKCQVNDVFSA
ncbi:MAG: hypothetical protein LC620_00715, partial [Halobacteriales archaeon]|nr:hypothetical protein [Halobacteriales archaeon]